LLVKSDERLCRYDWLQVRDPHLLDPRTTTRNRNVNPGRSMK
jgi:hypothetical protein